MCIFKNKWRDFQPTKQYLLVVSKLISISKLYNYSKANFDYIADKIDYWKTPIEFMNDGGGDCLEENTRILVKNGIKKIKDLRIGDLVLSYNYISKEYEYKKVINKWNKGILEGNIIKLRNGYNIIVTDEHRFFCRISERNRKNYKIKKLKDINLDYWCKRQIHCVYYLPEGDIDINKDMAYIFGIFLAEGFGDKKHVRIAQDKKNIREKIENALDNLGVPYSKSRRIISAYYSILNSEIRDKLKKLGSNSFNKQMPSEVLNWNKKSLMKLIEGMLDGDGTDRNKEWNLSNDLWEFSTSSEQVAKMFNIICRKVYGNCWFYKQENHQGAGNKPIYRLRYNPKSYFNKEIFNGISTVSIKSLEKISNKHYYDIEVEDNHNFVLADSGVISHNCEDWARWYVDILVRIQKKEDARFIIHSGYNKARWGDELHHHAICVFKYQGKYAVLDVKQFASGYESHLATGYRMFPDGITRMEIRDWQGKILEKKRKWIGVF